MTLTNAADRTPGVLIAKASEHAKHNRIDEAIALLRDAVRSRPVAPHELDKVGRLLAKWMKGSEATRSSINVMILGQCTTSWIATAVKAIAWGHGANLDVKDGEYDNVIQELMATPDADSRVDVFVLVPWTQRLLSESERRPAVERIEGELVFWQQAWSLIAQKHRAKIVQVGFDWMMPGPLGHHLSSNGEGDIAVIRRMNELLRTNLPDGAFFVDLEQVSGGIGRAAFYDPRRYFWTKQPFSERGSVELAEHLWSAIRAVMFGPKKLLVLDLDNTLWGGVVGETGPLGIALGESPDGEAYRAFQKHVKGLSQRGVVLAIASKNNHDDAMGPFHQNTEMVLKVEDFAHVEAHWEPKDLSLRRIADRLQLGLDSIVFFDDNPAERELVRQSLPDVAVVDVPSDPAEYVRALQAELWFETVKVLESDTNRALQYQQEQVRRELQNQFTSMDDYLTSLEMRAVVSPIDPSNIQRVVQLLGKTNQFNVTTRRHSHDDVHALISTPGAFGRALSLRDRFGDHGLVSVMIAVPVAETEVKALRIDTWLMSCRVISRTVEEFFFNFFVSHARQEGWQTFHGEFIPTKKNALVADLFDRMGFDRTSLPSNGESIHYQLKLDHVVPAVTFIQLDSAANE